MTIKTCPDCKVPKPMTAFTIRKDGRPVGYCRPCVAKRTKVYSASLSPAERASRLSRKRGHLKRYNLTVEQFDALLDSQGWACEICKQTLNLEGGTSVDHDHACCAGDASCGKCVRGLLCRSCNTVLAAAGDNVATLNAAAIYLGRESR